MGVRVSSVCKGLTWVYSLPCPFCSGSKIMDEWGNLLYQDFILKGGKEIPGMSVEIKFK